MKIKIEARYAKRTRGLYWASWGEGSYKESYIVSYISGVEVDPQGLKKIQEEEDRERPTRVESSHEIYEKFKKFYEERRGREIVFVLKKGLEGVAFLGGWLQKVEQTIHKGGGEVSPFSVRTEN